MALYQQIAFIVVLCFLDSCSAAATSDASSPTRLPSFASFISKYSRTYTAGTKEYEERQHLYKQRLAQVQHHNSKPTRLWNAAVNHLSDRTEAELSQLRGLRPIHSNKKGAGFVGVHNHQGQFLSQIRSAVVPDEKFWTHLSSVKQDVDQSACGSCWAIATSVMLDAGAEIAGLNRTFSAQELVNCVPNPHNCGGSGGCQGATVELGMNWVMESGLETSGQTPYTGVDGSCSKKTALLLSDSDSGNQKLEDMIAVGFHPAKSQQSPGVGLRLKGWERLPENEYQSLIQAVAERGPAAVSVGAGAWAMYGGGIFDGCDKDSIIDHAVTLIGYGADKKQNKKFWLIKNSWGNGWGEDGTIRLLREEGNVHCGTDNDPKVGTGCDKGPSSVKVCGMCGILYDAVVPHFDKK